MEQTQQLRCTTCCCLHTVLYIPAAHFPLKKISSSYRAIRRLRLCFRELHVGNKNTAEKQK